jgi:hypothetical protein
MRRSLAIVMIPALTGASIVLVSAGLAHAGSGARDLVAQQPGEEPETEGEEGADPGGTKAETGAGEGESEEAGDTGPPWTYQMARIGIAMLVLLVIGLALLYRRLIVVRRRGEV